MYSFETLLLQNTVSGLKDKTRIAIKIVKLYFYQDI
jgi:hypothetical protein